MLDRALYLPRGWTPDQTRRREAGIPDTVTFATKPQLAQRMLERAVQAGGPAAGVTGDERYGSATDLRRWLEQTPHPSILAVSANHPFWDAGNQERADRRIDSRPAVNWGTRLCGAGSQGERWYDWACVQRP